MTSSTVVALPRLDAATLIIVPVLLGAVVLAACYIPARRAARVDPMVALRDLKVAPSRPAVAERSGPKSRRINILPPDRARPVSPGSDPGATPVRPRSDL